MWCTTPPQPPSSGAHPSRAARQRPAAPRTWTIPSEPSAASCSPPPCADSAAVSGAALLLPQTCDSTASSELPPVRRRRRGRPHCRRSAQPHRHARQPRLRAKPRRQKTARLRAQPTLTQQRHATTHHAALALQRSNAQLSALQVQPSPDAPPPLAAPPACDSPPPLLPPSGTSQHNAAFTSRGAVSATAPTVRNRQAMHPTAPHAPGTTLLCQRQPCWQLAC